MKNIFIPACLALLCLTSCTDKRTASWQMREMSMSNLQEQFADPGKEYRSAPLWVWNTAMTEEDIDRMLQDFKDQGFGGAFVHPRPGLETEYLSDEWFRLWRYSVEKGKELGLDIWIYDENSYPSGFGGGHVPDEMPESYNQGQALLGERTAVLPESTDDIYLCLERTGDSFTDITDRLAEFKGKESTYYIYRKGYNSASPWTAGFPYVDITAPGVTEKFIEVTMKGYEKEFGDELGSVVKGIFTDEPQIASTFGGHCRWTPLLFDRFQEMWGYDLRTSWPLLGEQTGNWKKVRHDYNATLLRLFIERWSMPWYEYTEAHGMKWTGHYWEHEWPWVNSGPDNMAMYAWHQQPSIDMLFNTYSNDDPRAQFGNVRSVKELRSVANQMGYERTLSETYGGSGWDMRFQDFKRLGDWEYALGVNFMNQHLCHTTITGVRKYDYPPEFTRISPWWEDYAFLNDYFGRLSLVLSQGEQMCDWLILEPTTSLWLHGASCISSPEMETIGSAFQQFVTRMEKRQMEYDLGSEDIMMRNGSAGKGGLRIGCRNYHHVVLPPGTENLESSTFRLLERFVRSGGELCFFQAPAFLDGEENEDLKAFFAREDVRKLTSEDELMESYEATASLKFSGLTSDQLFHQHRTYDDGELIFLTNVSLDSNAEATFSLPCTHLYKMDAFTGAILTCSDAVENGKATVSVNLNPVESCLYFASDKPIFTDIQEVISKADFADVLAPSGDVQVKPVRDNILNLDFCSLTVDGQALGNFYVKEANSRMWRAFGSLDPWETAVQFRHDILDRDTLTTGNVQVEYQFFVEEEPDAGNVHFIVERPDIWNVNLNGTKLDYIQDQLLDSRCGDFKAGNAIRKGTNHILLTCSPMSIHAEIGPVMVLGNFGVKNAQKGFTLVKAPEALSLGAWKDQFYPEYPWEVSYSRTYDIAPDKEYALQLCSWAGTDAQVLVNGVKVGNISLPPYRMTLTPFLKEGENRIEVRVVGSMKNLYGPHYVPLSGIMAPNFWDGITGQRAGQDYDLLPYGLAEDFQVLCR